MNRHWSDCAIHNAPALPAGPCDCGGLELADDTSHSTIPPLVTWPGGQGAFPSDGNSARFVEPEQLPADRLIADAAATGLPDAHDSIVRLSEADSVDFDTAEVAIVPKFKDATGL